MPNFEEPQGPIEAILQNMLGANNVLRDPQSRNEALLLQILDAMSHGGGAEKTEAVSGATPTIAAADNTCYVFTDAVTSITISSLPSGGLFELVFLSGSTATEIVGPEGQEISLAEGCEIAAEMINDMSVRCCTVGGVQAALATVGTWEPPAAEEEEETE